MAVYPGMEVRKRIAFIFLVWAVSTFILVARLFFVQGIRSDHYRKLALDQRLYPIPVDARRGTIFDRNGKELAVSVSADSIYAVPADIENPKETALALSRILNLNRAELERKLRAPAATVWVKRKVEEEEAQKVKELGLKGIRFTERGQRFYPHDMLAAQVLGIAGIDNQGLEGLEFQYDSYLRGKRGQILAERDARGREIPGGARRFVPPEDGCSLYLTIDEVIQYIAERELDRAMEATKSKRGIVIVMDPKTGEILAMAARPTYDPDRFLEYPDQNRRNIAISDAYEPGSTFKIITAAAALEEGVVTPETEFFDPGFIRVEDRNIRCWAPGGHGHETFVQATENSCNPVFASIGMKLGKETFYKYIKAFGFGEPLGIDFPGEAGGALQPLKKVGLVEIATIAFGQGISVTPLQLLNALCAIANGGELMRPMLVKKIVGPDGNVVREMKPQKIRQVISRKTAEELSRILESVVVNGSGSRAQIPGYRVAGKTGTAEKPEAGRYGEKRVASFLGFAPVGNPRIAAIVVLDEPDCGISYGGVLAAPVFKVIVEDALNYMGVRATEPVKKPETEGGAEQRDFVVPNVKGLVLEEAASRLNAMGFRVRVEGTGDSVKEQVPQAGAKVPPGTTVILHFGPAVSYDSEGARVSVPDLKGMTMKAAAVTLGKLGLRLNAMGTGFAVAQEPPPGTEVAVGTVVNVTFQPEAITEPLGKAPHEEPVPGP